MKTYYIFRHGDTFATKNKTDYGNTVLSAPILLESKPMVLRLGMYLKKVQNPYCVSSEILRCRQTVTIVNSILEQSFIFDKRLNELYMESFDEFAQRIESFVSDIELSHYNNSIICTHGAGLGAMKHLLIQEEIVEENLIDFPAPGILWIIKEKTIQEIDFR